MEATQLDQTQKEVQVFLDFPDQLYQPEFRTEKKGELRDIIMERHVLSRYFTVFPLVVKEDGELLARCVLTVHPGDETAYLGFFESRDHKEAAARLFAFAEKVAREQGCNAVEGPMNASFWLGYRLKVSHFAEKPYFTELYHPAYYQELWEENGFETANMYRSNVYAPVEGKMPDEKYRARFEKFQESGYTLRSPDRRSFADDFRAVAQMIQELFRTFPVYKPIRTSEFLDLFAGMKVILNYRYVKLAYDRNGRAAGFLIAVPDYGELLSKEKLRFHDTLRLLYTKWTTRRYVILYMGVRSGHEGLGSALVYAVMEEFRKKGIQAISSYIQEGKVSGGYVFASVREQREYRYYRKALV